MELGSDELSWGLFDCAGFVNAFLKKTQGKNIRI